MMEDLDYVKIYARKLKEDSSYFKQHKLLIDSQIKSSRDLFKNRFGANFKVEARKYLKSVGLL